MEWRDLIISLLSGFMGAVIGAGVTAGLYWHSRYAAARRALIDKLKILRHEVWWKCGGSNDVFKIWDENFKDVWLLYSSLIDIVPFWKRKSLRSAWYKYKGIDTEILRELKEQAFDSVRAPVNKEDFLDKINATLKLLRDKEFEN